jgi:predicted metal-binding membrane protein
MRNSRRCTSRRAASSTKPAIAETTLETLLRRDRAVVLGALAALALLCWAYLVSLAATPAMAGMSAMAAHWSPADALATLAMWSVMMVGMMTPSVAPMILIYARVGRQAAGRGTPFASAGWFALGYFLAWTGFAVAATALQWGLERALLVSPMVAAATPLFGGFLLIAAGVYQWTPLKNACLSQCQSPLQFIQRNGGFRGERRASVALGARHGAYCIGCCWALMLLLFVGGVMNLLWIAAIGGLVLAEKLIPGRLFQRAVGIALAAAGALLLIY